MTFRTLTVQDYEQYKELISSFRQTEFSVDQFSNFVNKLGEHMQIWILEENSRILATATIMYETKLIFNVSVTAHIEDVCVHPDFRGKGIGSQIMDKVYQEAKARGCRKVTLVTSIDTIKFYTKNDYEVRGVQLSRLITPQDSLEDH
jgi:ribosomal protein S18 acetylase RimI-like enzyme